MLALKQRLVGVRRDTWLRWGIVVGGTVAVLLVYLVWGPDTAEVEHRLEEKYGVERVVWGNSARFEKETLVVDGRDIAGECTVSGEWGSLDNVRIECTRDVGIGEVVE
jgi:hypothetical protein